jgi:hypothetical protein
MESEEILRELRSLKATILRLTREVEAIKETFLQDLSSVEKKLLMRGIRIFRKNPPERLFFPPDLSPLFRTRFYEAMKRYSFRLVLRDVIKHQDRFRVQDLTHYSSVEVAQKYCDLLLELEIIRREGKNRFRTFVTSLPSFGPTLEWFIAEMFQREFASPAIYGVSVKETDAGGDYDVIASWNRRLVYVEAKSSPPRGVELNEITAFFSRIEDLLPEVAFLFNDTQLRMKDKLVVLFEDELKRRYGKASEALYPVERLVGELFHVGHRIFIVNSKKDVAGNFSICLRDYLRHGERHSGWMESLRAS